MKIYCIRIHIFHKAPLGETYYSQCFKLEIVEFQSFIASYRVKKEDEDE